MWVVRPAQAAVPVLPSGVSWAACPHPACGSHAPGAPRPLPPVDLQERRQDRHPHPDRRPARRLPPLVRQPPPPARAHRRTRGTQPHHRRSRPPLEPLADTESRTGTTASGKRGLCPLNLRAAPSATRISARQPQTSVKTSPSSQHSHWPADLRKSCRVVSG